MRFTAIEMSVVFAVFLSACGSTPHLKSASPSPVAAAGGAGYSHGSSSSGGGSAYNLGAEVDPDCAAYGDTYASKPGHGRGSLPASLRGHNGEKQCACHWDSGVGVGLMCQTGFNAAGDHNAPYCVKWISCR